MTEGVVIAIVSVAGVAITGMFPVVILILNNRQQLIIKKMDEQDVKLDKYHKEVNGKVSLLLESRENESVANQKLAAATGEITTNPNPTSAIPPKLDENITL